MFLPAAINKLKTASTIPLTDTPRLGNRHQNSSKPYCVPRSVLGTEQKNNVVTSLRENLKKLLLFYFYTEATEAFKIQIKNTTKWNQVIKNLHRKRRI